MHPKAIRQRLIDAVPAVEDFGDESRHHDAQEWISNLMDAVGDTLPAALGEQWRQLYNIGVTAEYVCDGPEHHRVIKAEVKQSLLSVPVLDDDKRPIKNIEAAIAEELRLQWVPRRCSDCNSQMSAEHSAITSCPEVGLPLISTLIIELTFTGPPHSLQAL